MRKTTSSSLGAYAPAPATLQGEGEREVELPAFPTTPKAVSSVLANRRWSDILLFIVVFVVVLSLTPPLVLAGASIGFSYLLGAFVALLIATLVVCWPISSFYIVTGCVVLIEQEGLQIPIFTDRLYVFHWPTQLEGLFERPIGFLLLFAFLIIVCRRTISRQKPLQGGSLFLPFLCFLLCVIGGVLHGLLTGGNLKIIVLEVRPFWYLFVAYLLAYNLVRHKNTIRAFFWIVIVGAGVKGLQGVYIYYIVLHGDLANHHEIMAHEESFFFVALILLLVLFCMHYRYRPQFYSALLVLPWVFIALIANQRRADFVALILGIVAAWILTFIIKRHSRKVLITVGLICIVLGAAYVAAFANSSGGFGEPARAVVTVFHPDPQEAASNLYRDIENYDLTYTVKQNPLGLGFGKPFLQPVLLPNIITLDPYYLYIPHNTVYWVWMRLGPIGYFALWYLFGAIIIRGGIIARSLRDPYLQLVAIYIVAVILMEVTLAFADYQLYFFRNVLYVGLLAGILVKLPALDEKKEVSE